MSVVGFVAHYVHFLDPSGHGTLQRPDGSSRGEHVEDDRDAPPAVRILPPSPTSTEPSPAASSAPPILLLGGYSYGAMITSQLPSLGAIVALFDTPECGSPAAEIRLRAQHLAEMQSGALAGARAAALDRDHRAPSSSRTCVGLRVGGDEERRASRESRRSLSTDLEEAVRHGVADLLARTKKGHRRSGSGRSHASGGLDAAAAGAPDRLPPVPGQIASRPAYLLVSPLQGIVTNLVTMSLPSTLTSVAGKVWNRFSPRAGQEGPGLPGPDVLARAASPEAEDKLVRNSTLAIYGDQDDFVPVRKLRDWSSRLAAIRDSKFRAHEVSSADHFWTHGNTAYTLRDAVQTFGESLLQDNVAH